MGRDPNISLPQVHEIRILSHGSFAGYLSHKLRGIACEQAFDLILTPDAFKKR